MHKGGYVYILASRQNTTLYIGVTNNVLRRVWEHKCKETGGFTKKYNVTKLVYYEAHPTIQSAIRREKQMKVWRRQWKNELIEQDNPEWKDLFEDLV